MNFRLSAYALLLLGGLGSPLNAHAHVHGQGEMMISQEQTTWQIMLVMPAGDVLGFEHAPKNDEQRQKIREFAEDIGHHSSFFRFDGNCSITEFSHNLDELQSGTNEHHDVEIDYEFTCSSSVRQVTVNLFDTITAIDKVQVQWFTEQGQGMQETTPTQRDIVWQ